MHIVVSGSTGLLGRAVVSHLEGADHEVTPLVRPETPASTDGIAWDPAAGEIDREALEGVDAVVHLAGESINQRWTATTRERILESRVRGTRTVAEALGTLDDPPDVLLSASAVGYYGDRGDEWLEEDAEPGDLFISDVCRRWEEAAMTAAEHGVRVVPMRLGVVLSAEGGALPQMLPPFKFGLGGHLGSGDQYLSWVTRDDAARAVGHLLDADGIEGPVNVCSPEPVSNRVFTDALGTALGRPTVMWVPGFAVRLMFGQMGEELLLASGRMRPAALEESGFEWDYRELRPALEHALAEG